MFIAHAAMVGALIVGVILLMLQLGRVLYFGFFDDGSGE